MSLENLRVPWEREESNTEISVVLGFFSSLTLIIQCIWIKYVSIFNVFPICRTWNYRLGTIYAMAGTLWERCFLWLVGLSLAHQSVHLGNEGKKWVILQHSPFPKEQRESSSSVAQWSLPWWRQRIPAHFTNSSSRPWFFLELKPCPWLLLFWCAFSPATLPAYLWPQQGTNSILASKMISHAAYHQFCSVPCATCWKPCCPGVCLEHGFFTGVTQSKMIFSISLVSFCFSFWKQFCWYFLWKNSEWTLFLNQCSFVLLFSTWFSYM